MTLLLSWIFITSDLTVSIFELLRSDHLSDRIIVDYVYIRQMALLA